MALTSWQNQDVVKKYLTEIQGAIPYGSDQLELMMSLISVFPLNQN